eukprot:gene7798-15956_t
MFISKEFRLVAYAIGLYTCFIYWGYLQEKLTSVEYKSSVAGKHYRWDFPFFLNFFMGISALLLASVVEWLSNETRKVDTKAFAIAAITCAAASPIGYAALKYISFPLMILTKSSKPVPLMLIGVLFYKKQYTWYKYLSMVLLCSGCILFSSGKKEGKSSVSHVTLPEQFYGIFLVGINLFLDGYTNNEQDSIFKTQKPSGIQMMKHINLWQAIWILLYLVVIWGIWGNESELYNGIEAFTNSAELRYDILLFCICASVGQVLIFTVMKEFGSLTWITISLTRKLFTVLLSVFAFNHSMKLIQWLGIIFVFTGLSIDVVMSHLHKHKSRDEVSSKSEKSE